jgi:hypothetical protein
VCDEGTWPYEKYRVIWRPSRAAYGTALYQKVHYRRIYRLTGSDGKPDLTPIRRALINNIPVICGFAAYKSFVTTRTGRIDLPTRDDLEHRFYSPDVAGQGTPATPNGAASFGHAAVIIGYYQEDDGQERFRLVNSWGEEWGDGGTFTLSADYLASSLASDFWTITTLPDRAAAAG